MNLAVGVCRKAKIACPRARRRERPGHYPPPPQHWSETNVDDLGIAAASFDRKRGKPSANEAVSEGGRSQRPTRARRAR